MDEVESLLSPVVDGMRRVLCCHKAVLSGRFPPNSLAAIQECVAARAPRVEFDVWVLADGAHLVFHDHDLERQTGRPGTVADQRRETVAALRAGEGTRLAFLEEIVEAATGSSTVLQVDLKGFLPLPEWQLEGLARALEPVAGHAIVGSLAHWNVRALAAMGLKVAFDTTLHWHRADREAGDGLTPSQPGLHGLWDDAMLAHLPGVAAEAYIAERIEDLLGLVAAAEWMVDWRTLFHLQDLGMNLGSELRRRGVGLAAWTLKDEGAAESTAKMMRLFGLGATTVITEAAFALGGYLRGS